MTLFALGTKHPRGEVLSALGEAFCVEWADSKKASLTYLDTFDWRLFRNGWTLARIQGPGAGVLLLREGDGTEWSVRIPRLPSFASVLPPGVLGEKVRKVSGIRRLLPRVRVAWKEEHAAVLNEDKKTVVRLRLGEGLASQPGSSIREPVPSVLEVQELKGYGREAKGVGSFLWKRFGLRKSPRSEMAMAVEALGQIPGLDLSAPEISLTPGMGGAEAARTIHRALFSIMLHNQDGVIRDLDPEFLHDFRVAIRRIRAALGQIKGVFPPRRVEHFSREFRWLGSRTGPTRDMDVYLLKIPGYQAALPEGVRDQLEPLVRFLEHKKRRAHGSLVRTMGTKRFQSLMTEWNDFLEAPEAGKESAPEAPTPILAMAKRRIWKVYRRVLRDGRRAGEGGNLAPAVALHELRIECKGLRYLMGIFRSLFPPDQLGPLLKALRRLQDTLGDFNDLHVQQVALRGFADEMLETRGGPPETLMAMGRLMGQLETQQGIERSSFQDRFNEFAKDRNVKRFRKLFKPDIT